MKMAKLGETSICPIIYSSLLLDVFILLFLALQNPYKIFYRKKITDKI